MTATIKDWWRAYRRIKKIRKALDKWDTYPGYGIADYAVLVEHIRVIADGKTD